MTRAERAKLVQVRIAGCPSGSTHHPDDADWRSNIDKQPCYYYEGCQRCLCPQCGFPMTTLQDPDYTKWRCWEHRGQKGKYG